MVRNCESPSIAVNDQLFSIVKMGINQEKQIVLSNMAHAPIRFLRIFCKFETPIPEQSEDLCAGAFTVEPRNGEGSGFSHIEDKVQFIQRVQNATNNFPLMTNAISEASGWM